MTTDLSSASSGTPPGTRGIAVMACDACRRLKMRCVGSMNPPCDRCAKAKRQCVITSRHRTQSQHVPGRVIGAHGHHESRSRPADRLKSNGESTDRDIDHSRTRTISIGPSDHDAVMVHRPGSTPEGHIRASSQPDILAHKESTSLPRPLELPSVYSVSPLTTGDLDSSYLNDSSGDQNSRSSVGPRSPVSASTASGSIQRDGGSLSAIERDIYHLVDFFHSKMAMQTPIFLPNDFSDIRGIIRNRKPLAICIAFVTARFVPGCRSLRNQLIPDVLNILKMAWDRIEENEEDQRTLFQAFGTLATYASPSDAQTAANGAARYGELSPWALRSLTEMFALRISLHRSWDQVSRQTFQTPADALASPSFRRYLLWLWLFTMSHHGALLMRTPPTISEDMSIRSAPSVLGHLRDEYLIKRVLAEVELCLLWGQAGTQHRELGEWWCSPQSGGAIDSRLEALRSLDAALVSWSERWQLVGRDDTVYPPINSLQRTSIDFHYRFVRFCVATYVARFVQLATIEQLADANHEGNQAPLSAIMSDLLLQSMKAAMALCTLPLELSPIQKDLARYIPHLAFAMLAFPCYFVMRAAEVPGIPVATTREYFANIKKVAETFCEMAADEYHCAAIYGKAILEEVTRTEKVLEHNQAASAVYRAYSLSSTPLRNGQDQGEQRSAVSQEEGAHGTGQPDAMNFSAQGSANYQWQPMDGVVSSPEQFSGFGDFEGWFLNNFWDV